jgi:hypothetical protein
MPRRIVILTTVAVGLAVAVLLALLRDGTATGSTPGGKFAQISNDGQAVAPGPNQQRELQIVGAVAARRLARRDGRSFYRLARRDGSDCYSVNTTSVEDRIGGAMCPMTATAFPSSARPILDFSLFEATSHVRGNLHVVDGQGFAADGVASVALLDESGRLIARSPATDNVYTLDVPHGQVATTIAAYADDGTEVARIP